MGHLILILILFSMNLIETKFFEWLCSKKESFIDIFGEEFCFKYSFSARSFFLSFQNCWNCASKPSEIWIAELSFSSRWFFQKFLFFFFSFFFKLLIFRLVSSPFLKLHNFWCFFKCFQSSPCKISSTNITRATLTNSG